MVRPAGVIATVVGGLLVAGAAVWLVLSVGAGQPMSRTLVALLMLGIVALGAVFSVRFETQSHARAEHTHAQMRARRRPDRPLGPTPETPGDREPQ